MLGILIGIAAVILTVGLGQGAPAQVGDQINALGSNLLIVSPGSATSTGGVRGGFGLGVHADRQPTPTALASTGRRPGHRGGGAGHDARRRR